MTKPSAPRHESIDPRMNYLLAQLDADVYDALLAEAKIVQMKFRKRVIRQDQRIEAVYFPLTCMLSLLVTSHDEPTMELATIGKEGVTGAAELLQGEVSIGLNLVQIPGYAVRMGSEEFNSVVRAHPVVEQLVHRHNYALMRQILFGAACNRIHSMEERCARWLLMTHDRAGQDTSPSRRSFSLICWGYAELR
jgi:CRP-like cAMP-binding protein